MVFEQFLESDNIKKHSLFIFLMGIFYVAVSHLVFIAFEYVNIFSISEASIVILFTTTIVLVPSFFVLLGIEEKIESKEGLRHFFHNHKDIFKIFIFFFLGIFFAFLFLGNIRPYTVDYQMDSLEKSGTLASLELADEYTPSFGRFAGFISWNLFVIIIAFVFSVFYGAGALLLIVLNASIFAAFISYVIKVSGNALQILFLFLVHMIPEMAGFLVAAIAGGVVSRAITREKLNSEGFRNVMRDALVLLLIAFGLIVIAGFLETYVTPVLVKRFI